MASEVYSCELDPESRTILRIYLFTNVQNIDFIRDNIVKGVWKCSVIKASLIVDPLQVAVAANKAVLAEKHNSMITKTVFAEILYNLSLTKNISQSLSKFGIDKDNSLLFCFLITDPKNESEMNDIISQIDGKQCPVSDIPHYSSVKDIKSVYKLNYYKCYKNLKTEDLLDEIVSKMVTKNFLSH
ncbi:EKC/KEOPS complex subunit Tprkb-like [Plodia interpunctella]|uniref:EKC/KEOPS complex subunit Tprkb-like n=1 Tax=Plodia interpunctella TaxID=58824 RepID=UPI0023679C74|nr:EKC/KEOPS complex subunit Tprkb-like [Plodia interpunctella]XP_053607554.1 EKC/KEOPS complex subunit Tprkb-like [Plodia interpunctella]XP_053607555.1 EKC/KEOPS complex subunit Tprkb-like [Plodia interpunctella]